MGPVSNVILPSGVYFISVRAQDTQGGTGTAVAFGPLVVEGGVLTEDDLTSALDVTLASNDPHQIMNTVDSVSTVSSSADGGNATAQQTVLSRAVGALERVVGIVEPDTQGVTKLTKVVTNIASSDGNALDVQAVSRLSDVIDGTLDVVLNSGAGSVTKEALR